MNAAQARVSEDSRREPRRQASGAVYVTFEDPRKQEIRGQLIDVSVSGFRMAHAFASLEAGQLVEYSYTEAAGQARVVWNRITNGRVETGFVVIG
jgi:hypothetical protein